MNSLITQLAGALHRPAALRVPAPVLRLVMGELAEELLLASQRLEPAVLADNSFAWQHPSLAEAAAWVAGPAASRRDSVAYTLWRKSARDSASALISPGSTLSLGAWMSASGSSTPIRMISASG